jgi:uncharacterized protein YoxC
MQAIMIYLSLTYLYMMVNIAIIYLIVGVVIVKHKEQKIIEGEEYGIKHSIV